MIVALGAASPAAARGGSQSSEMVSSGSSTSSRMELDVSEGGVGVLRAKEGDVGLVSERVGRRTDETPLPFPVVSGRRAFGGWLFPLSL